MRSTIGSGASGREMVRDASYSRGGHAQFFLVNLEGVCSEFMWPMFCRVNHVGQGVHYIYTYAEVVNAVYGKPRGASDRLEASSETFKLGGPRAQRLT